MKLVLQVEFVPAKTTWSLVTNVTNVLIHTLDFQVAKVCSTYELEYVYVCTFKMYGLFSLECGCNLQGTEKGDPTCNNDDGKCNCKCDVDGDKCDTCELGHQGFPDCHGKFQIFLFNIRKI